MSSRLVAWVGMAVLAAVLLANTFFIVDQREQVVVVRFGDPVRVINFSGKAAGLNVKAPFLLTRTLHDALRRNATTDDPSRVVMIGSIDGLRVPVTDNFPYSASKAGIHMLTRHLARTLVGEHITVNAIAPGPFESKMMAFALDDPASRTLIEQSVPRGRIGTPEDMAGTVLFLCSRAGAYLTGTVIPVDGGISTTS